jgi:hypothetical protein
MLAHYLALLQTTASLMPLSLLSIKTLEIEHWFQALENNKVCN